MASTYSTNLKLELIGTGEQAGTWGSTTNTNLGTALEQAVVGKADINMSSTTITLTLTNTNAAQNARAIYLNLTGTPGGAATLEVPAVQKPYIVKNGSNQVVTVKVSGQTGVAVPVGKTVWVYNNGTDVTTAIDHIPSLTLGAALPVASGGSGATTLTGVLKGNGTSAFTAGTVNLASEVAGTLPVANGGTGQTSYTNGQLLIGNTTGNTLTKATLTAGTGISITNGTGSISIAATNNGTVTSVDVSGGTTGLTTSGGPITSSGTVTLAGTLAVTNGGTGATTNTTARTNLGATTVGSNFFTLANPSAIRFTRINADNTVSSLTDSEFRTAIGAGTGGGSVTSVSGTGTVQGLTLSGTVTSSGSLTLGGSLSAVNLASQVTGTLPVANGGTGQTSYTNGQLLIGNTTGNTLTKSTLTAGTGISITNGTGSISIAATNNGTVTSVATGTGLTGGPITSTGTVSVATNGITDTLFRQSAAYAVVGRSASTTGNVADITAGSDHQVLRRSGTSLGFGAVALNQANAITGTLGVANGGTGATTLTANNVILGNGTSAVNFVAPGTSGNVLTSNGTTWTSAAPAGSGFSTLVVLTSSQTWTVPSGVTRIKIYVIGAGGGPTNSGTFAGGGGGATAIKYLSVTPGSTASVTIGSGGGVNTNGGNTTFVYGGVTYTGGGGKGGNTIVSYGVATNGDINVPGSYGGYVSSGDNSGGFGGMSIFPGGGQQGNSNGSQAGYFYGGGGSSHVSFGNGSGFDGAVVIEY